MRQVPSIRDGKHDVCGKHDGVPLGCGRLGNCCCFSEYCRNTVQILVAKEQGVLYSRVLYYNSPAITSSLCEH